MAEQTKPTDAGAADVFDPRAATMAALQELYAGDAAASPDEADDAPRGGDAPDTPSRETEDADTPGETTESSPDPGGANDEPNESADESAADAAEEQEPPTADQLVKNPEAFIKAHAEIKAKAAKRAEKIKELMAKLAEREQAAESPGVVLEATHSDPLASVGTVKQLEEAKAHFRAELKWCRENRDGGEKTVNGKVQELSEQQVAEYEEYVRDVLDQHLDRRRDYLTKRDASIAAAQGRYPVLAPNHALYKDADASITETLRKHPDAVKNPEWVEDQLRVWMMKQAESGKYGITRTKDGKMELVALQKETKPAGAKPAPKTPPLNRAGGSTPAARKTTPDEVIAQHLESGDIRAAIKAQLERM